MDTASVLQNSEFVRINVTDDVAEMQASLCTFLYWFGDPAEAAKYDSYGCQGPYGISPGEAGMVDINFNVDRDTLGIHIERLDIGTPQQDVTKDTEYRLQILINGATDDAGNTLAITHYKYTYFLTQQESVTTGEQSLTLLHDEPLTLNIPAGALSGDTTLTAYTHFYPTANLPAPLWFEYGTIGFIKAFHLELEDPGVSITSPLEIQVQYDDGAVPGGYEESPRLYQRNGDKWELKPGSGDPGNNRVSYDDVTELGDFAVIWGYQYGDLFLDGAIDAADAQLSIFHIAGFLEIYAPAPGEASVDPFMAGKVGDVNGDTVINVSDTLEIIDVTLGRGVFSVLPPLPGPRVMPSSTIAHTAFLSSDAFSNSVSVILDDATDVFAADVELTYNPRLLKISEVSKTSLTSDSFIGHSDKDTGHLRLVLVNPSSLSGAGSLADIKFELMPDASRTAALDSIKLTRVELNAGQIKTTLGLLLPQKLALLQNYPNPFNPETWIPYELNRAVDVEVRIYNVNGQLVRRLPLGQQLPGSYITKDKAVYWDGANDRGEKVSSGVYFYQLQAGEKNLVRKMVILK
jgi:hypothetical protein